jgi:hypothetical protein
MEGKQDRRRRVDSYRFLGLATRHAMKTWAESEPRREIPWTPLDKPLRESTVALVSTAGLALATDPPFDQEGERRDPWWGDPSFRVIPWNATERDVRCYHMHINSSYVEEDLDTAFPLAGLRRLAEAGEIGRSAPRHYSFMGYILEPRTLLAKSTPDMIRLMREDAVDAVLLVPF